MRISILPVIFMLIVALVTVTSGWLKPKRRKFCILFSVLIIAVATVLIAVQKRAGGADRKFLTRKEYKAMLDELENSEDIKVPAFLGCFPSGQRPTYIFVCSVCGKETRYWRKGIPDSEHIERKRQLVQEIRELGCDASLDDSRLCRYCHPERFLVEQYHVAATLRSGIQEIPHMCGSFRYVPKDMKVSVLPGTGYYRKDPFNAKVDTFCAFTCDQPYSIVEKSLLDDDNRLKRDVYATSFIILVKEEYTQEQTRKVCLDYYADRINIRRFYKKGTQVVTDDIQPPVWQDFVDTNDYSRYCLVSTTNGYGISENDLICIAYDEYLGDVQNESGVNAPFDPVFLSVNGGRKRRVRMRELHAIISFLKKEPMMQYGFGERYATKSMAKWLREILLNTKESVAQSKIELAEQYITYPRLEADGKSK